jgi:hypothetical protein
MYDRFDAAAGRWTFVSRFPTNPNTGCDARSRLHRSQPRNDGERIASDCGTRNSRVLNPPEKQKEEVPTLQEFWPRLLKGHARANRQKPSGIASKEMIARVYLLPLLGDRLLDVISTERVQQLKATLTTRADAMHGSSATSSATLGALP